VEQTAILALEDGRVFRGVSVGAAGRGVGEVVFNTAMTGYQEILTDPSYCQQIVTLTCPHIGNVGCNPEDEESDRVYASGLVIRDRAACASNWRSTRPLGAWLHERGVVAIAEIDTRSLTRVLREEGAKRGCIAAGPQALDADAAIAAACEFPGLLGADLARAVSTAQPYAWHDGRWRHASNSPAPPAPARRLRIVAFDYGVKRNILRLLVERGCEVTVVPAATSAGEVLAREPDGVFLSNGPGDPQACDYAIGTVAELVGQGVPVFGICLGQQLLALACGARTVKLKFGHHGANHPVLDLDSGRVLITSQNHGFAVDEHSLPATLRVTHRSLFDGTVQGIAHLEHPAFAFQGHPEASPGPHDIHGLFDRFCDLMIARAASVPRRSA